MENFFYGIEGIAQTIRITTIALINHPLIWGFGIGFLSSTFIHLFIVTDIPHAIPAMVRRGASDSFRLFAQKDESGTYPLSYSAFQKEHTRVRSAFYLAVSASLLVAALALLRS